MPSFLVAHDHSWPREDEAVIKGKSFGCIALCPISGCTNYLHPHVDVQEWFDQTGIKYWFDEPISGYCVHLHIPDDGHGALFKLAFG
jgi:hypothetical protein